MRADRFTMEEVRQLMEAFPGWELAEERWMVRRYRFASFQDSIAFVNGVAATAEELNHHPMIAIDYRMVTLRLTTWSAGGLTELDRASALAYDRQYEERRPGGA